MPEAKHITGPTPYASSGEFLCASRKRNALACRSVHLLTAKRHKNHRCSRMGWGP